MKKARRGARKGCSIRTKATLATQAGVAQLAEHLICNQGVTGSKPVVSSKLHSGEHHHARIAQLAERFTRNEQVAGSIPSAGSKSLIKHIAGVAQRKQHSLGKGEVVGSNPTASSGKQDLRSRSQANGKDVRIENERLLVRFQPPPPFLWRGGQMTATTFHTLLLPYFSLPSSASFRSEGDRSEAVMTSDGRLVGPTVQFSHPTPSTLTTKGNRHG